MNHLIYPKDGDIVKVQTDTQRNFGNKKKNVQAQKAFDWLDLKRFETEDCTKPLPITFRFDGKGTSRFELAYNKEFSGATVIQTTKSELTIENLFVNKTYYWRVNGGETACFRTEDVVPRWINIDGLSNVRDNGNRKTADGRRTKQGLLFRGTEMDIHHNITDKGKWQITEGIHRDYPVEINILPPKSGIQNNVGLEVTVNAVIDTEDFLKKQENDDAIEFTVTL